jgi:hypothetical protein
MRGYLEIGGDCVVFCVETCCVCVCVCPCVDWCVLCVCVCVWAYPSYGLSCRCYINLSDKFLSCVLILYPKMSSFKKGGKAPAEEVDSDEENGVEEVEEEEAVEETTEDTTLNNPEVLVKYQEAAKICNTVMAEIAALCVAGTPILSICVAGENLIQDKVNSIFKGKNKAGKPFDKGAAFPVCISVNEIVCHYSPLASEDKVTFGSFW